MKLINHVGGVRTRWMKLMSRKTKRTIIEDPPESKIGLNKDHS